MLVFPLLILLMLIMPFILAGFFAQSIFTLLSAPTQIFKIAGDKRLRRNHALEHATINVIEEQFGPQQMGGIAHSDGFTIRSAVPPQIIENAARIGLNRMSRGDKDLAIHRRCGTSIAVANLLSSVLFLFIILGTGRFSLGLILLAIIGANMLGPLVGDYVQRYITTSTDVQNMEIVEVEMGRGGMGIGGILVPATMTDYFVRTREIPYYRR